MFIGSPKMNRLITDPQFRRCLDLQWHFFQLVFFYNWDLDWFSNNSKRTNGWADSEITCKINICLVDSLLLYSKSRPVVLAYQFFGKISLGVNKITSFTLRNELTRLMTNRIVLYIRITSKFLFNFSTWLCTSWLGTRIAVK